MDKVLFKCPVCGSGLEEAHDAYRCGACDKVYPIEEGIPSFLDRPIYWGELDEAEMDRLVENAARNGWREAVAYIRDANPVLHQYIADGGRARWRMVLDTDENTRVLDLGSGYGSLSVPMAKAVGQVVSIDSVPQRAKFLKIRAHQEGLNNVLAINGDVMRPPLQPEQFDIVILNGMLEWVAVAETEGTPQEVQIRFLKNVFSLLREGGHVYIGIENRFGYWAWAGGPDHSGLKYTSLMPKFAANWYVKMKARRESFRTEFSKDSYRTYIYSSYGFRKLLEKAGFRDVNIYTPYPSYNHVDYFVSLDDPTAYRYFINTRFSKQTAKTKLMRWALLNSIPFGLHKVWSPSYGITACKRS